MEADINYFRLQTITFCNHTPLSVQSCTNECTVQSAFVAFICIRGNTQQEGSTGRLSQLNCSSVFIACYMLRLLEKPLSGT